MKKKILSYVLYIALAIITASCIDPNENNNVEITVVTSAPTEITSSTAQCGGQVTTTSSVFLSDLFQSESITHIITIININKTP